MASMSRDFTDLKALKTERSHEENQERAFIAASRRGDRSIEARVESAQRASRIHKARTGKSLRITTEAVLKEEMYDEEDDDHERNRHRFLKHLQEKSAQLSIKLGTGPSQDGTTNAASHQNCGPISSYTSHQQQQQSQNPPHPYSAYSNMGDLSSIQGGQSQQMQHLLSTGQGPSNWDMYLMRQRSVSVPTIHDTLNQSPCCGRSTSATSATGALPGHRSRHSMPENIQTANWHPYQQESRKMKSRSWSPTSSHGSGEPSASESHRERQRKLRERVRQEMAMNMNLSESADGISPLLTTLASSQPESRLSGQGNSNNMRMNDSNYLYMHSYNRNDPAAITPDQIFSNQARFDGLPPSACSEYASSPMVATGSAGSSSMQNSFSLSRPSRINSFSSDGITPATSECYSSSSRIESPWKSPGCLNQQSGPAPETLYANDDPFLTLSTSPGSMAGNPPTPPIDHDEADFVAKEFDYITAEMTSAKIDPTEATSFDNVNSVYASVGETSAPTEPSVSQDSSDSIIGLAVSPDLWKTYFKDGFWQDSSSNDRWGVSLD